MDNDRNLAIYQHFLANVQPGIRAGTVIAGHALRALAGQAGNPLARCGGKVYSQNDEDGITFEILRRLGLGQGVFAEFGVGNGMENNTLALAAAGWPGFWVGGEDLAFDPDPHRTARPGFHFSKQWIRRSNIVGLYRDGLAAIGQRRSDLVSIDLDGNDYYFVETLLEAGAAPSVFIVEYNAKFRPPIRFRIDYDDEHRWAGDDYFGASLATFVDLFSRHDYFLACCNLCGVNAFFVRHAYRDRFRDVPGTIEQLYEGPKYFLVGLDTSGHPSSPRTIATIFSRLNPPIPGA